MLKPNIYISTCDSNSFVLKYFQYFFNKYWDKELNVKILGFNKPNIEFENNFEFISLGENQVGGAHGWTNYLINYFESINDECFVFGLDDFMICRPVEKNVFSTSLSLMNDYIGRIDLQPLQYARDPSLLIPFTEKNSIKYFKLAQSDPNNLGLYRISAAFSIWNKKWFLKNMKINLTPWEWELQGTEVSENDGYEVLGSYDKYAIKKSELLSNNWAGKINVLGIKEEDIKQMKTMISPDDRAQIFEIIGEDTYGYKQYAGNDWLNKIFGE